MPYIIDADVHISPDPQLPGSIRAEELIRRMDSSGVDKALTWIQPPYRKDLDESLAYLYQAARRYPQRILAFGWADPRLGVEKARDTVRRCIEEYGFYGVKLNGAQNEYSIDDPSLALPVVEEIAKAGKPIAFHIGGDSYENTHPFRLAKIAKLYPQLPILMVHMGGAAFADLSSACIEVAAQHPNITLVGSAVRDLSIVGALRALGPERLCFGSDTPFYLMHACVAMYEAILDGEGLDSQARQAVWGENLARAIGLPLPL